MAKISPIAVQKALGGIAYPASKQTIVEHARRAGADEKLCQLLDRLPDREFTAPVQVSQAIAHLE
jgi:uncharacterized protein DUF2795